MVNALNTAARRVPTWAVYLLTLIPVPYLLYLGMTGGLGREPVERLEHELGEIAIQLLIVGLCISPLRRFAGVNLLKFRRTLGVLAFTYVCLHLLVWAVLDVQSLERVWADIVKRPYITIGMAAFVMLLPLALTSNNWSVRKLGPAWRRLHLLTYPIVLMSALHFIWVRKGFQIEPLIYAAVIIGLLALRWVPRRQAGSAGQPRNNPT
ncbi:MAG: protein-methionine-sulfoxide reductase heme-binding subunit MsrQ [Pseudomonadota bacterium]